jgi:hypothetical protein
MSQVSQLPRRASIGAAVVLVLALALAGCSGEKRLPVPQTTGDVSSDAVAVVHTLGGIEIGEDEACPWTDDRVLIILSADAFVEREGPTLVSDDLRLRPGDRFEAGPAQPQDAGFDCGGQRWDQAVIIPGKLQLAP